MTLYTGYDRDRDATFKEIALQLKKFVTAVEADTAARHEQVEAMDRLTQMIRARL